MKKKPIFITPKSSLGYNNRLVLDGTNEKKSDWLLSLRRPYSAVAESASIPNPYCKRSLHLAYTAELLKVKDERCVKCLIGNRGVFVFDCPKCEKWYSNVPNRIHIDILCKALFARLYIYAMTRPCYHYMRHISESSEILYIPSTNLPFVAKQKLGMPPVSDNHISLEEYKETSAFNEYENLFGKAIKISTYFMTEALNIADFWKRKVPF